MNTKQLLQFTAVAHAGSITEASKRLHIAQPALSHAIGALEDDLGVKLFARHRRGVSLTDSGAVLLDHAQTILRQMEYAREAVLESEETPSGPVSIALPASVAHATSRIICETVLTEFPQISLSIDEGLTGNLNRFLRSGRIDMMLDFDVEKANEFIAEPLIKETLFLTGSNFEEEGDIRMEDVRSFPLFLPSSAHAMGKAIARYEKSNRLRFQRMPIDIGVHPMLALVDANLGYSISPWSLIYDRVESGHLTARRIVDPQMTRTAYLVSLKARMQTSAHEAVASIVRRAVREVHERGMWRGELLM